MRSEPVDLRTLRGLVATCVGVGGVDADFAAAREEMRVFNVEHGFRAIEYRTEPCVLVEAGRDAVALHALQQGYDWCLQIDADAAPFPPDACLRLLQRAYVDAPDADAVGAYCQLKQAPHLPTIDTGTGTWEVHYPGEGLLPVIRTGGHFLLVKTAAYRRLGEAPWHRTRVAPTLLRTLSELDNAARQRFSNRNPFAALGEWDVLLEAARQEPQGAVSAVGEDSGFCDRLTAAGGRLYVDTDLVAGHVTKSFITPQMLKGHMDARARQVAAACGARL